MERKTQIFSYKGKAHSITINVCHWRKKTISLKSRYFIFCGSGEGLKNLSQFFFLVFRRTFKAHGFMYFAINAGFSKFQGKISYPVIVCLEIGYIVRH